MVGLRVMPRALAASESSCTEVAIAGMLRSIRATARAMVAGFAPRRRTGEAARSSPSSSAAWVVVSRTRRPHWMTASIPLTKVRAKSGELRIDW